jgi:spermidine/putrescine transport system substrate-binding protein
MMSNAGIAYNKARCPDFEPTWRVFGDKKYARSCTLLNDMRETIGAALKALGYSLNTTSEAEVSQAADLVIEWSKNIAKFDNELYKNGIANGHFVLVHGYNGDLLKITRENEDIVFAHPKEGVSIACDEMVIMKNAKSIDLAYAFINFVHDPEIAARNMEYNCSVCPNSAAYDNLSEEFRSNESIFVPEEIRAKSETIRDLGDSNTLYIKAWDRIKAAQ